MNRRTILGQAALLLMPLGFLNAQSNEGQPAAYVTASCVKVSPGREAEFEKVFTTQFAKFAQVMFVQDMASSWSLSRAVAPLGEQARCDYLVAVTALNSPPEPPDDAASAAMFKKAGLAREQFWASLRSMGKLVEQVRLVRYAGTNVPAEKGDYFRLNLQKAKPDKGADFRKFEQDVWLPMAQESAKNGGALKAWMGVFKIYPGGTDQMYDHITLDVFRDWASIWKPMLSQETIAKAHPGKSIQQLMEPVPGLRDIVRSELYRIVELVRAQPAS